MPDPIAPSTTTPTYYMTIVDLESNFQDFEYGHMLDREKVQHAVGTLFQRMRLETKVQHALQRYHVNK